MSETSTPVEQLRNHLAQWSELLKRSEHQTTKGGYVSIMDFVAQHGQAYEVGRWGTMYRRGQMKECFGNSYHCAIADGLRYVEGYAIPGNVPFPVHHAWNLTPDGKVLDVTWGNTGIAYLGIEFSIGRMDDAINKGSGCVIDDWQRRFPLLQQRWTGEDFTKKWRKSKSYKFIQQCGAPYTESEFTT